MPSSHSGEQDFHMTPSSHNSRLKVSFHSRSQASQQVGVATFCEFLPLRCWGFSFRSQLSPLRTSLVAEVGKVGITSISKGFCDCAWHTLLPLTSKSKTKAVPPKQRTIANLRFLFPYLATTPRISWVFAKVEHGRLDCEYRRPSPNFAEWVPTMFPYQYASQTQACCEPCDLLWKLTLTSGLLRALYWNGSPWLRVRQWSATKSLQYICEPWLSAVPNAPLYTVSSTNIIYICRYEQFTGSTSLSVQQEQLVTSKQRVSLA